MLSYMIDMTSMSINSIWRQACRTAALAIGLCLMHASAAGAVDVPLSATDRLILQNEADLRALENRLQRQLYQQRQQQFRQEERLYVPSQRQPPPVPVMRPGCQGQIYGNIRTCR